MKYVLFSSAASLSVVYIALLEYCVHRWVMHFPGLGKNSWWRDHAIEHHGHSRNDVNISLSASVMMVGAAPMLLLALVWGWVWTALILFECIAYAGFWSALHAAFHDVGSGGAILRCQPWYSAWLNHHLLHHDHPGRNFGAVFIWTDRIFATNYPES